MRKPISDGRSTNTLPSVKELTKLRRQARSSAKADKAAREIYEAESIIKEIPGMLREAARHDHGRVVIYTLKRWDDYDDNNGLFTYNSRYKQYELKSKLEGELRGVAKRVYEYCISQGLFPKLVADNPAFKIHMCLELPK